MQDETVLRMSLLKVRFRSNVTPRALRTVTSESSFPINERHQVVLREAGDFH